MKKLLFAICLLCSFSAFADYSGIVVGVTDGDTISVLDSGKVQHKIRLSGIDAPEKKQAFGMQSKKSLSDLVINKNVAVQSDKKDRYGRELGKILVGDVDINLEQIKSGMAWHYKKYERTQSLEDRVNYGYAEDMARAMKHGLWSDDKQIPPWGWRKGER